MGSKASDTKDAAAIATTSECSVQITRLESQRALMIEYLRLRLDLEDWHGVMDAAADIREIDAKLSVLKRLH